jgi:hypothetical protein
MLEQALETSHKKGVNLVKTLAAALGCDTETVVECLAHSVLGLRARNTQLHRRLAWATPSSSFLPAHLLPDPEVQLVPSEVAGRGGEDQLIVVGKSSRPPGAHHRPAPGEINRTASPARTLLADVPSDVRSPDTPPAAEATSHRLGPDAVVRPLPTRRIGLSGHSALPNDPGAEATGTDAACLAAPANTTSLTTPRPVLPTATVSTLVVGTTGVMPARDETEPATLSQVRGPLWIRHQIGIKISVLWLVALAVCIGMLFTPAPTPAVELTEASAGTG